MIDIKLIREKKEETEAALRRRDKGISLDTLIEADKRWREILKKTEDLRKERRELSKGPEARDAGKRVKEQIEKLEQELKQQEVKIEEALLVIPNIPDKVSPDEQRILKQEEAEKKFDFEARPHWDLGKLLGILDFDTASQISGARFPLLKNAAVRLEFALLKFFMDENRGKGYHEIIPPYLVLADAMKGTGQLPKFEEELYRCERDSLYLIPTGEVPLGNIFRDKIFDEENLPVLMQAFSPCFRREAGSYGKDTKGLIRNHQFHKVELFKFTKPEDSEAALESMLEDASGLLKKLGLPFRIVELACWDMGFSAAHAYDLEVWMPGEKRWLEVSSCSNCRDFQARRTKTRVRRKDGKIEFVHTLNGSGLALGRIMAAILENYQRKDSCVDIPEALRKYVGQDLIERE